MAQEEVASKPKVKPVHTAGFYDQERGLLFEQVKGSHYLRDASMARVEMVEQEGPGDTKLLYLPYDEKNVPWLLCTGEDDKPLSTSKEELAENIASGYKVDREKLWKDIYKFLYDHVELPDDRLYNVLTGFVVASWVQERFDTVPYIFFFGPKNSGKSRGLITLQYLCYRADLSGSSSASALFRGIEKDHLTVFMDEAEVFNMPDKQEVIAAINAGYNRDTAKVKRFIGEGADADVRYFNVFGMKALAGTSKLRDTTETRCIFVRMTRNTRDVNLRINKREALRLRNQLLCFRFEELTGKPEGFEGFEESEDFLKGDPGMEDIKTSRVNELFHSLLTVSNSGRQDIIDFAHEVYHDQEDEETASLEAETLTSILECEQDVLKGRLAQKTIVEAFNKNRLQNERFHTQTVGGFIRRLGFKRCRMTNDGSTGYYWDEKLVGKLRRRYHLENPSNLSNPSDPSVAGTILEQAHCFLCDKQLSDPMKLHQSRFVHKKCYEELNLHD